MGKQKTKAEKALDAAKSSASNARKKVKDMESEYRKKLAAARKGSSGGDKNLIAKAGTAAVAGVGISFVANKIPVRNPVVKAALPLVVAAAFSTLKPLKKNKMASSIVVGSAVVGGLSLLKQFAPNVPLLAGEDEYEYSYMGEQVPMLGNEYMGEQVPMLGTDFAWETA